MEENPCRCGTQEASRKALSEEKHRYRDNNDDESSAGQIKCSGKSCRSCTGGMIADCVAVCCCPCAVVSILTLTFIKVPYKMTRKCLAKWKKKKKRKSINSGGAREGVEIGGLDVGGVKLENDNNYSARFEAEKVWLELYQVGHLGFGRVSFNGIQSLGGN